MLVAIPTQIDGFIKKQKQLVRCAKTSKERAEAFGFWAGFLNGMRMTGVLDKEEYNRLYKEMILYSKKKTA